jgi:hypothetical protein
MQTRPEKQWMLQINPRPKKIVGHEQELLNKHPFTGQAQRRIKPIMFIQWAGTKSGRDFKRKRRLILCHC